MTNSTRKRTLIGLLLFLILISVGFYIFIWPVKPTTSNLVVELGDYASEDIHDYLYGFDISTRWAKIDLSQVDTHKVGDYPASVTHGFDSFQYTIHVLDTTPPTLIARKDRIYVATDIPLELETLFTEIYDLSDDVTLCYIDSKGIQHRYFKSSSIWSGMITVRGIDAYGNYTDCNIALEVDTPPRFNETQDYYIATGSKFDLLNGITATDDVDGDLTSKIKSNINDINLEKAGDYVLHLSVSDQYGLCTEEELNVHVLPALDLQNLINTQKIKPADYKIIGAFNIYDNGVLEKGNLKVALERIKSAIVAVTISTRSLNSRGSGFIASIDDKRIIIFTNHHVVAHTGDYKVEFFDGTKVPGKVLATTDMQLGASDMALVSVETKLVPEHLLKTLTTVHVNEGYWKKLRNNDDLPLGIYVKGDSLGLRKTDTLTGKLLLLHGSDKGIQAGGEATEFNIKIYSGTSGSAVIDEYGNLIAMVSCASHHKSSTQEYDRYWGVPLDRLLAFYKEHIGKPLNYQ